MSRQQQPNTQQTPPSAVRLLTAAQPLKRGVTHIWPEEPITEGNSITFSAVIELPDGSSERLFNKIPLKFQNYVSDSCDSFLTALLIKAAEHHADVKVHGQVSPSLLKNLVEFQNIFRTWYPATFNLVEITADHEVEDTQAGDLQRAICGYSGGVDSSYTIYRHCLDPERNRYSSKLDAGLFVQGIDIPLSEDAAFNELTTRYEQLLQGVGVELITLQSNFRDVNRNWIQAQGLAMASFLMLFKKRFNQGLISSTDDYNNLVIPFGCGPITDHLLSSDSFSMKHDGSASTRSEKFATLTEWTALYDQVRVCFKGPDFTRNCGRCYKCMVAWLCVQLAGERTPQSLPAPSVESILRIRNTAKPGLERLKRILNSPDWKRVPPQIQKAVKKNYTFNSRQRFLDRSDPNCKQRRTPSFVSRVHRNIGMFFA